MNILSQKQRRELLSQYLDGELSAALQIEVETLLAADPQGARELENLRRMKEALAARPPLSPDPMFYRKLRQRMETEAVPLSPRGGFLNRRLTYALAAVGGVCIIVLAATRFSFITEIFSGASQNMEKVYSHSFLKDWIMPLLSKTDRDDVLQFAMFGVLPLDTDTGAVLRLHSGPETGYRIQLAKAEPLLYQPVTVSELYDEVRPTRKQRQTFDTLFENARKRIEEGVLVGKDNRVAIDPQLSDLQRVVLSGMALALDQAQRARLEQFLARRNAAYALNVSHTANTSDFAYESRPRVMQFFDERECKRSYCVVSPDTVTIVSLKERTLLDTIRHQTQLLVEMFTPEPQGESPVSYSRKTPAQRRTIRVNRAFSTLIKSLAHKVDLPAAPEPIIVVGGNNRVSIQIGRVSHNIDAPVVNTVVVPRPPQARIDCYVRNLAERTARINPDLVVMSKSTPLAPSHPEIRHLEQEMQFFAFDFDGSTPDSIRSLLHAAMQEVHRELELRRKELERIRNRSLSPGERPMRERAVISVGAGSGADSPAPFAYPTHPTPTPQTLRPGFLHDRRDEARETGVWEDVELEQFFNFDSILRMQDGLLQYADSILIIQDGMFLKTDSILKFYMRAMPHDSLEMKQHMKEWKLQLERRQRKPNAAPRRNDAPKSKAVEVYQETP